MNLLGIENVDCPEAEALSLDKTVSKDNPPCFIWATANDGCVDAIATLLYATALHKNKIKYECHVYPDGPHGLATCDDKTYEVVEERFKKCKTWLDFSDDFLKKL